MFRGLTACSLDAKSRVTVPSHYRKILMEEADSKVVLTIDTEERCLLLYPQTRWLVIEEELQKLPSYLPAARRIQRLLIGHATDLEIDRQGRILIPNLLCEYAGLDKSVMLVGHGKKVEIWGEPQWQLGRDRWLSEGLDTEDGIPQELQDLYI